MARTKTTTELTVEEQIAQIQKEAAAKVKELRSTLSWDKRFKTVFNAYLKDKSHTIVGALDGHKPDDYFIKEINIYLREENLSLVYDSATFDNSLYNQSEINTLVDDCDLSEYATYTVFSVMSGAELKGYIQIKCNYSSYNGNEYSNWSFVKPKEITCTVFTVYQP